MTELHAHLPTEMGYAQERQQENADQHSRLPAPSFQVGDRVWLNTKNIRTRRPSQKLDNKRHGPYEIKEKIGTHAVTCVHVSVILHRSGQCRISYV